MECNRIFCDFGPILALPPPPPPIIDPENQNFEKMKKTPKHLEILSFCTCAP